MSSMSYTLLNTAQGIVREYYGSVPANSSVSIASDRPHDIWLVLYGSWNYSGMYLLFPNNGSSPVSVLLGKYGNNPLCTFSANGNWGITVNNTSTSYAQQCAIYRIMKYA